MVRYADNEKTQNRNYGLSIFLSVIKDILDKSLKSYEKTNDEDKAQHIKSIMGKY